MPTLMRHPEERDAPAEVAHTAAAVGKSIGRQVGLLGDDDPAVVRGAVAALAGLGAPVVVGPLAASIPLDGPGDIAPTGPTDRSLTDLMPGCPSRPPDWRWRRAVLRALGEDRRRRWDDDWVARARRSLASPGRGRRADPDPAVSMALGLRDGPARRRWELEARLLAGQADDEIAGRLGVEPGAVHAYERLFFDVRDWLECTDWIAFHAIGPEPRDSTLAVELEVTWKSWGFFCGPSVLDVLIESSPDEVGRGPTAIADPWRRDLCDLAIAESMLPATAENAIGLLRLQALIRGIDLAEAGRDATSVTRPIATGAIEFAIGPDVDRLGRAPGASETRGAAGIGASAAPVARTDPGHLDDRRLRTAG